MCFSVEDFSASNSTSFVQLVLEIIHALLQTLPVRQSHSVTSFERALLTVVKTRQMESITVNTGEEGNHKHPVLALVRLITRAKDAKIVRYSTLILSRLIMMHQLSLTTVAKAELEEFLTSVGWLLREGSPDVTVELWRFLALCDSKQPRLLDLFINLEYKSDMKKVRKETIL